MSVAEPTGHSKSTVVPTPSYAGPLRKNWYGPRWAIRSICRVASLCISSGGLCNTIARDSGHWRHLTLKSGGGKKKGIFLDVAYASKQCATTLQCLVSIHCSEEYIFFSQFSKCKVAFIISFHFIPKEILTYVINLLSYYFSSGESLAYR